ncbi:MAG: M1 family metallopeptidase [Bacteroidales bacterium]|nr:M1 family metallopeptidase [Bacteroidales bacterium]
MKKSILVFSSFIAAASIMSQPKGLFMPEPIRKAIENHTRTHEGLPGAAYWQNSAGYDIEAEMNPQTRLLIGSETITYRNNSPDSLRVVVIKLLQNIYKKGMARDFPMDTDLVNDGVIIEEIHVRGERVDLADQQKVREYGTNLFLILGKDNAVPPGADIMLSVKWHYTVTDLFIRTGVYRDSSFFMGYWFPQVAVYDDIDGWDTEQYTGLQETYNDLADFDVRITIPSPYIVWATGDLGNSSEIFSAAVQSRIERSMETGEIIHILTMDDRAYTFRDDAERNTWHYHAGGVPDFAWAAGCHYLWDATSVIVDSATGRRTWVNAVYPPDAKCFTKAIGWAAHCIEYFSTEFPGIPFPFNKHISYNGQAHSAMEFPMIANDCDHENEEYITEIVAHEIAHTYIPFTILTNERHCAWMDEGLVKLFGELFTEEYGNDRENFRYLNTTQIYTHHAGSPFDLPLIMVSSALDPYHNFGHSYAKAVASHLYLFEMLEAEGEGNSLKEYFRRWTGKHPTPYDFFATMGHVAGRDLSWFWEPWFFNFAVPDLAIGVVKQDGPGNPVIRVVNKGGLPLPIHIEVTYDNGEKETIDRSVAVWEEGNLFTELTVDTDQPVIQVILGDPGIIDIHPVDNQWKAGNM